MKYDEANKIIRVLRELADARHLENKNILTVNGVVSTDNHQFAGPNVEATGSDYSIIDDYADQIGKNSAEIRGLIKDIKGEDSDAPLRVECMVRLHYVSKLTREMMEGIGTLT